MPKQTTCHPDRKHWARGLCKKCYARLPEQQPFRRRSEQRRRWKEQGIVLTQEQYDVKLELQGGLCAICQQPPITKRLAPDHDHTTGVVRELLCVKCNTALGLLDHNSRRCIKAAQYLAAYERDGFLEQAGSTSSNDS